MLIFATVTDLLVIGLIVAGAISIGAFLEWNRRRNRASTEGDVVDKTEESADDAERYMRLAERRSRLELKDDPEMTDEDSETK